MRRKLPSICSCQPHSLSLGRHPSNPPSHIHLLPSQAACIQACHQANPLSVFCPISFPPLQNTSYYPTLMISMPSSSCLTKLSLKYQIPFQPPSYFSSITATSPSKRIPPLTRSLVFHPHQEARHPHSEWRLKKNRVDSWTATQENRRVQGPRTPRNKHGETLTGIPEVEETQALSL
ncbi:1700008P02Rik [Phodopus roborovskii]|uniref:1700008P02Rik protein n=1 Tax=Phodopus roborovskii TaxID=109678 RepID=A0AAU9YPG0_PHORO|nr:1700008P02Rik [Phodopus roborovskii]